MSDSSSPFKVTRGWEIFYLPPHWSIAEEVREVKLWSWDACRSNMMAGRMSLHIVGLFHALVAASKTWTGLHFVQSPSNVTSSLGKPVSLQCNLQGKFGDISPPDVLWFLEEDLLEMADTNQIQLHLDEHTWVIISTLSIDTVQLPDMGSYRCAVMEWNKIIFSFRGHIQLEGLPHFSVEPMSISVVANTRVSLLCVAHGPPEPVHIIWLQDGLPLNTLDDPMSKSPSHLKLTGLNRTSSFSCEAQNRKGVASSSAGTLTVVPAQPGSLHILESTNSSIKVTWEPGFGGDYPINLCYIQAQIPDQDSNSHAGQLILDQNLNVPPATYTITDLKPFSTYQVRVACQSSQGLSQWTPWVFLNTAEGVPTTFPDNITAVLNGSFEVLLKWTEPEGVTNGHLLGYRIEYKTQNNTWVQYESGQVNEMSLTLEEPLLNITLRVCAYTGAGQGPWSPVQTVFFLKPDQATKIFSWHWWYVVMAIACALALSVLMVISLVCLHQKVTHFGETFEPTMESGEMMVRYHARRTYSRRTTKATLNTLGISDVLKQKLLDVMVDRHKLTLGKTLGEGEFGSVMEGLLTQEDSTLRVAVKTMKIAICTQTEMEDFLQEAACMKEFDHQNVMKLLGVCLQTVESDGYPSPVVILPYMKHGDLHSYLLYSRLSDCPVYLPSQMLVKFMMDIARGMEYLSSKNFIHRDLAARNCMLNENMNVCVADFGLSKKIYSGDYYRQGRISKMPVKWIAIESLADRVYTTKSDVWSFGVTMWEIATRGQTPYPGVENSEIYDYLCQGNRLRHPSNCLDSVYMVMFSCWLLSPKDRPSFKILCCKLEKILEELLDSQHLEEVLYVNMDDTLDEMGAVGGLDSNVPRVGLSMNCCSGNGDFSSGLADGCSRLPILSQRDCIATEDIPKLHQPNRYVLCPQHELNAQQRHLVSSKDELLESYQPTHPSLICGNISLKPDSFSLGIPSPTLQLQAFELSTPVHPHTNASENEDDEVSIESSTVRKAPLE